MRFEYSVVEALLTRCRNILVGLDDWEYIFITVIAPFKWLMTIFELSRWTSYRIVSISETLTLEVFTNRFVIDQK